MIKYTHPNLIATTHAGANDSKYNAQKSLHGTPNHLNAHINIEPAWDLSVGEPFVRVGVFDDGVWWKHTDFKYKPRDRTSRIVHGWDYQTNNTLMAGNGYGSHGTPVTGIIGAVRNNDTMVAGIAGGNDSINQKGVSLYALRILSNDDFQQNSLSYVAEAIRTTAQSEDSTLFPLRYGLHIMNCSWGFDNRPQHQAYFTDTNITLLSEAIHFANRMQVTVVASRGNEGINNPEYPAILDDDWIMAIGGTGTDGEYIDSAQGNGSFSASTGWEIDVAAPAAYNMIMSTRQFDLLIQFNGTSASAPHVAGVAALLMSYLNNPKDSIGNMAPEDVEYIIQMTATDTDLPGVDSLTGHGRLNAGAALHAVNKDYRKLVHYGTTSISNSSIHIAQYSTGDTVVIPEHYKNKNSTWFRKGKYVVNTYQVSATVNHNLPLNDSIVASWPRHSSSNVLPLFGGTANILVPHEKVSLNSVNKNTATLTGYIYEVKDTLGNFLGWWPYDTTNNTVLEYSLLLHNPQYATISEEEAKDYYLSAYPNPTADNQLLVIKLPSTERASIRLYDLSGRCVQKIFNGTLHKGVQSFPVNLRAYPAGIYFYHVEIANQNRYFKIIRH